MSRKPLSAKNSDYGRPPGNDHEAKAKPKRRDRVCFRILDRPSLIAQLNVILKDTEGTHAPMKLIEDDLLRPTVS